VPIGAAPFGIFMRQLEAGDYKAVGDIQLDQARSAATLQLTPVSRPLECFGMSGYFGAELLVALFGVEQDDGRGISGGWIALVPFDSQSDERLVRRRRGQARAAGHDVLANEFAGGDVEPLHGAAFLGFPSSNLISRKRQLPSVGRKPRGP